MSGRRVRSRQHPPTGRQDTESRKLNIAADMNEMGFFGIARRTCQVVPRSGRSPEAGAVTCGALEGMGWM